jgi:hypothetical protein
MCTTTPNFFIEMDLTNLFPLGWLVRMTLLISVSYVAWDDRRVPLYQLSTEMGSQELFFQADLEPSSS